MLQQTGRKGQREGQRERKRIASSGEDITCMNRYLLVSVHDTTGDKPSSSLPQTR